MALQSINAATCVWRLEVSTAGKRKEVPSGFQQAVPGLLIMFTLLVLLTSSGSALAFGTFLFSMDWGPDIAMVVIVLVARAVWVYSRQIS